MMQYSPPHTWDRAGYLMQFSPPHACNMCSSRGFIFLTITRFTHSGIPELKAYLNGVHVKGLLVSDA